MAIPLNQLSERERTLLHMLAVEGFTTAEIQSAIPQRNIQSLLVILTAKLKFSGLMKFANYYVEAGGDISKLAGREEAWAQLSPRKKRVAVLTAANNRNSTIAGQLYVGVNVISKELAEIYKILKINTRYQLPAVLANLEM